MAIWSSEGRRKRKRLAEPGWLSRPRSVTLATRELSLRMDLDIYAPDTYRTILRNLVTGAETTLGTGTSLTSVAISDGQYALRVEVDGRYWRTVRYAQEYPLTIVGGEIAASLPPVLDLAAVVVGTSVMVTWTHETETGYASPEDWAVWIDSTSPVDTSGAPEDTATYAGAGGYLAELTADPALLFVAVASRSGSDEGPVSEVAVANVTAALTSPTARSTRHLDGDWTNDNE